MMYLLNVNLCQGMRMNTFGSVSISIAYSIHPINYYSGPYPGSLFQMYHPHSPAGPDECLPIDAIHEICTFAMHKDHLRKTKICV
jgi:hypothetical protein